MGRSTTSLATAVPANALPARMTDSNNTDYPLRANAVGELAIRETPANYYGLCEEGSLLVATNPTVSTGQLWVAAQTAFSDTAPNFYIGNNDASRSIRMHSLKLICTAAATGTTAIHFVAILDTVLRSFAGSYHLAITPVNPNGGMPNIAAPTIAAQSSATVSALTASSANKRIVARGVLGGLNIVGDELFIEFGEMLGGNMSATAVTQAGQPGRRGTSAPPVMIPPLGSLAIHFWLVGSSASPAPEFEILMSVK
jgi:hypothetical protein